MFSFRKYIIREATKSAIKQVCGCCTDVKPCIVQVGDCLPYLDLYEDFPSNAISIAQFAKRKNLVIFGVLGAFSPCCSKMHLTPYLEAASTMKKDGIDEIVCVSVNDPYVMSAWGKEQNARGTIRMFADPSGCFTNSLGLGINCAVFGGFRSRRFSMVVVDNVINVLHIEQDGVSVTCTHAECLRYKQHLKRWVNS